jgi:hypothetical protein
MYSCRTLCEKHATSSREMSCRFRFPVTILPRTSPGSSQINFSSSGVRYGTRSEDGSGGRCRTYERVTHHNVEAESLVWHFTELLKRLRAVGLPALKSQCAYCDNSVVSAVLFESLSS